MLSNRPLLERVIRRRLLGGVARECRILQRQISSATKRPGNVLYEMMCNAISESEHIAEIKDLCTAMTADASVKAIVLTGAGPAFCAGGNVRYMRDKTGMFEGSAYELRNKYRTGGIQLIPTALYELEVPVVAAINGAAIGAGLDLACMCDIRIAAEGAISAESFVRCGDGSPQ